MKAFWLVACLVLAPALAAAQTAVPWAREKLLSEIKIWSSLQLVHLTPPLPLTVAYEPRVDKLSSKVQMAVSDAELKGLSQDFEKLKREFGDEQYKAKCRLGQGCGTLREYLSLQNDLFRSFNDHYESILKARMEQSALVLKDQARFYDGGSGGADEGSVVSGWGHGSGSGGSSGDVRAPGLHINETPLPVTSRPMSWASLAGHIDYSGISKAVISSVENSKKAGLRMLRDGYNGFCYYSTKLLMIGAKMLPSEVMTPEEIWKIGIGSGSAYMMGVALNRDPNLMARLHMRRLDLSTVGTGESYKIPERTVFVYPRGVAGFSEEHGHIEIALSRNKVDDFPASCFHRAGSSNESRPDISNDHDKVFAVSDGCAVRSTGFLRWYGARGLSAYVPVNPAG